VSTAQGLVRCTSTRSSGKQLDQRQRRQGATFPVVFVPIENRTVGLTPQIAHGCLITSGDFLLRGKAASQTTSETLHNCHKVLSLSVTHPPGKSAALSIDSAPLTLPETPINQAREDPPTDVSPVEYPKLHRTRRPSGSPGSILDLGCGVEPTEEELIGVHAEALKEGDSDSGSEAPSSSATQHPHTTRSPPQALQARTIAGIRD
jgi:hypothetical protein